MSRVGYGRTLGRRVGSPTSPTDRRTVGQIVNHVALAYPIEIDLARAGALVGDAAGYMDAITGEASRSASSRRDCSPRSCPTL